LKSKFCSLVIIAFSWGKNRSKSQRSLPLEDGDRREGSDDEKFRPEASISMTSLKLVQKSETLVQKSETLQSEFGRCGMRSGEREAEAEAGADESRQRQRRGFIYGGFFVIS